MNPSNDYDGPTRSIDPICRDLEHTSVILCQTSNAAVNSAPPTCASSLQCAEPACNAPSSQLSAHRFPMDAAVTQTNPPRSEDTHAQTYDETEPFTVRVTSQLPDLLFERYGFLVPGLGYDITLDHLTCWTDVRKILGDVETHVDTVLQVPIAHYLYAALRPDMEILNKLWDLAPDSPSPLAGHANLLFKVTTLSFSNRDYHFLRNREEEEEVQWDLVLEDAATVLECFRRDGESVLGIARFLLNSGRTFSTRVTQSKIPYSVPRPTELVILGWRPKGYQSRFADYAYYEQLRNDFMARPHARAAFLAGGIVWRLAMHSAGSLGEERALNGPSEEALPFGKSLPHPDSNELMWDDTLTEAEMNLICGVYKVSTGSLQQTSDTSWWPKQSTFLQSGLYVGYWSHTCESWFQNRYQAIIAGTATLKSASQWNNGLKMFKKTKALAKQNTLAASIYLRNSASDVLR